MFTKLSDSIGVVASASSADIVTPITTGYVSVANARRFLAALSVGAVAQTKIVTVQAKQATDASGTGAKNLGSAYVLTAPTGGWTQKSGSLDLDVETMDDANGFDFLAVTISSNNTSATPGGVTLIAGDSRFNP